MVLTSDNGGYVKAEKGPCNTTGTDGGPNTDVGHGTVCFNGEAGANNWPQRGGKYSNFEGGIRVNAFVSGGYLPASARGTKVDGMIHVADWYGTLSRLVGVDPVDPVANAAGLPPPDSVNVWDLVTGRNATSPRTSVLVTKDLLVTTRWKYALPHTKMIESEWGGPIYPNASTATDPIDAHAFKCPATGCLFDLENDPHEREEVSAQHPRVVKRLRAELERQAKGIWKTDHKRDPACREYAWAHGGFLQPWIDV